MAVRRLAFAATPGLDSGGVAWFTDLTPPAFTYDAASLAAPMGSYGAVLPMMVAGLMFANLSQAFARADPSVISSIPHNNLASSFPLRRF